MKLVRRNPVWISLLILSLATAGCVQSRVAGSGIAADQDKARIEKGGSSVSPQQTMDENGEWLLFQVNEPEFNLSFNYEPLPCMAQKTFQ